jgi:Na+/melibiose symporter-like transporter
MLTRRMQKRKLFMILCGLDVAVRVVMWFVGYQQVTMLFILLGLSTLFVMMTNILTSSMIADTIEYAEYHTTRAARRSPSPGRPLPARCRWRWAAG